MFIMTFWASRKCTRFCSLVARLEGKCLRHMSRVGLLFPTHIKHCGLKEPYNRSQWIYSWTLWCAVHQLTHFCSANAPTWLGEGEQRGAHEWITIEVSANPLSTCSIKFSMYVCWSALCQLGLPHIASCTPKDVGIFADVIIIEELKASWSNNFPEW